MVARIRRCACVRRGFIEHWLSRLLFWNAPAWVFTLIYTSFALLVVAIWWRYPPRRTRRLE